MTDINELLHAIRLSERLADGVAHEADRFPTENMTRVREALASARIRLEELAISADVDLDEDHAVLDDRLRRAMTAIAKAKGVEVERDPYADIDETEVTLDDGRTIRLKSTTVDIDILIGELRLAEETESLTDRLKRAQIALAEAKVSRQTEGVEAELLYLYRTDPAIRLRVRQMIDARMQAA